MPNEDNNELLEEVKLCAMENCDENVAGKCKKCGSDFCITHASEVDPVNYCILCLIPDEVGLTESPLIDKDGVQHKGRTLTNLGEAYKSTNKLISEMTDVEISGFITMYKVLLHDAERVVDYRRITLASAEHEKYERQVGSLRMVGGTYRFGTTDAPAGVRTKVARTPKANTVDAKAAQVLKSLKALGLTPEMLTALLRDAKGVKK